MTLKELKKFISKLPSEMDEFDIVNGEVGYIDVNNEELDNKLVYRVDKPIIALYVDESSNEICFFHQTQDDVNGLLKSDDNGTT